MRKTVDLLLENGRIYTMVSEGDCVEALCVKDGVIVYTGTAAEAERLYDAAEVVDLGGRVMLPGMGDSHLHFFAYCQTHTSVDLGGCRSREEAIALLKARADETPKGQWVRGANFDESKWADASEHLPTKAEPRPREPRAPGGDEARVPAHGGRELCGAGGGRDRPRL